jgi:hypothetical protein
MRQDEIGLNFRPLKMDFEKRIFSIKYSFAILNLLINMALSIFYVYSPVIQQWPFNGATSKLDGNLGQTLANLHFWANV